MPSKRKVWIGMTGVSLIIVGAVITAGLGDQGWVHKMGVRVFGPPVVAMTEAYSEPTADAKQAFDHAAFDALLQEYVDADGWVDYTGLLDKAESLDAYIASLAEAPFEDFGRDEKLAMLINAYNAFTLRLILDHHPLKSITDIPDAQRWDAKRWVLAGQTYSLNQIEHELIRPKFVEPRIHFALVCAAYSCPPLRNEAYTGEQLESQLAEQSAYTHAHDRWFRFDQANNTVYLTALYDWYGGDFKAVSGSVLEYVADQVPALRSSIQTGGEPRVRWLDYDWKLNDIHNAP